MIPRWLRTKRGSITTAMAAAAIASGAAIAAIGPGGAAVAFFSPPLLLQIHVASATLVAKGAGVDVALQVQCAGTKRAFVDVSLNERFGKQIANGYGSTEVLCTGGQQTVVIRVLAEPVAFKHGVAIANAEIFGCTRRFCGNQQDSETITITK